MEHETIIIEPARVPLVRDLLHALGQPLTALQMCVLLRHHPPAAGPLSDHLLEDMADQVTSLTRLFTMLRALLQNGGTSPDLTGPALQQALASSVPEWRKQAAAREIVLHCTGLPEVSPETRGLLPTRPHDPLACSLDFLFEAALLSTPYRGRIDLELALFSDGGGFHIRGGDLLPAASFSVQFGLPTARALLASASPSLSYSITPFEMTLEIDPQEDPIEEPEHLTGHAQATADACLGGSRR